MPTEFDWKSWKKRQNEPPPPPPPEEPKIIGVIVTSANIIFYMVLFSVFFSLWFYTTESATNMKIIDRCNDQKGIAVRTVRGDTVCIKEDVLTEVLGKSTDHVK